MIPVQQTILSGPRSNCLQAAVASILERPIDAVPNFNEVQEGDWYWAFVKWLEAQGFALIFCYAAGFSIARSNGFGYHLMTVNSPRGDFHHELVGFNGKPVHDPYPGGNCEHQGIYSYEFLVPLPEPPEGA